jgi:hypothetical protein
MEKGTMTTKKKAQRGAGGKSADKAPPETYTQTLADNIFAGHGLLKGDVLTFEVADPRPGEVCRYSNPLTGYIGRFVAVKSETLHLLNTEGEECKINMIAGWRLARLVSYTRTVLLRPDPATDATPGDGPAPVIDLNVYRQAHPPRIRNLLFAEKGGAR